MVYTVNVVIFGDRKFHKNIDKTFSFWVNFHDTTHIFNNVIWVLFSHGENFLEEGNIVKRENIPTQKCPPLQKLNKRIMDVRNMKQVIISYNSNNLVELVSLNYTYSI